VPEGELVPAADRRGELDPVVEGDPEGSKLARPPNSPPLATVDDAIRSPLGSQTIMAIFVPPKSSPSTTGGCDTV